ncbi:MAG: hypothetical protein ACRDLB_04390 [Actinomycetota bacterium]
MALALLTDLRTALTNLLANPSLTLPLTQRAKFEGWLKVELGSELADLGHDVTLEAPVPGTRARADLAVAGNTDALIMLKTVNTNYRFPEVWNRTRPITKNVAGIAEDVVKLQLRSDGQLGLAMAVVFPLSPDHREPFETYLQRVVSAGASLIDEGHVHPAIARSTWTASWFLFNVPALPLPD